MISHTHKLPNLLPSSQPSHIWQQSYLSLDPLSFPTHSFLWIQQGTNVSTKKAWQLFLSLHFTGKSQ